MRFKQTIFSHIPKHFPSVLILVRQSFAAVGILTCITAILSDSLGFGTEGFGFGIGQSALLVIGITFLGWSKLIQIDHPLKRAGIAAIMFIGLFLLWSLGFYPLSGYVLNPFRSHDFSSRGLIVCHLTILICALISGFVTLQGVFSIPLEDKKTPSPRLYLPSIQEDFVHNSHITPTLFEKRVVLTFAIILTALMAGMCFFVHPSQMVDDLGLYNPVYMYLTYGKMTYPVYLSEPASVSAMFIHPPLRYLIMAWLMRLGCSSYYAASLPMFFLFVIGVLGIVNSAFLSREKITFLFGMFAPLVLIPEVNLAIITSMRPDVSLALGWFAGLIILESARIEGWNARKLFLGSFILTFASGFHYYGWVAWTGIFVYIIFALQSLEIKSSINRITVMLFGALCFGIPYLVFFVLPQFNNILSAVHSIQSDKGIWNAINLHIAHYLDILKAFPKDRNPYVLLFLRPVWSLKIPLAWFAWILFVIPKNTRAFALASLPVPVFVSIFSQGKSSWYYIPENMLYLSGIMLIFLYIIQAITAKLCSIRIARYTLLLTASFLTVACVKGNFYIEEVSISTKPHYHEMHLARACAKDIIGSEAIIAGRLELWYVSGATHWYDISRDLLWKEDISNLDIPLYFSRFDAIVDDWHMADFTNNNINATLSSWYADHTLYLSGAYLTNSGPGLNFLIFSEQQPNDSNFLGYGLYTPEMLFRFEYDFAGDYMFISMIGTASEEIPAIVSQSLFVNKIALPERKRVLPSEAYGTDVPADYIYTYLFPRHIYTRIKPALSKFRLRDEIPCSLMPVAIDDMLRSLQNEAPIKFYLSLEELPQKKVEKFVKEL